MRTLEAKYVIKKKNKAVNIFSPSEEHCTKAEPEEVYSAGFVKIVDGKVECSGGSTSLGGIMSKPETDEFLISKLLGLL